MRVTTFEHRGDILGTAFFLYTEIKSDVASIVSLEDPPTPCLGQSFYSYQYVVIKYRLFGKNSDNLTFDF